MENLLIKITETALYVYGNESNPQGGLVNHWWFNTENAIMEITYKAGPNFPAQIMTQAGIEGKGSGGARLTEIDTADIKFRLLPADQPTP